jgi:NADH dehydrogenase/NADH:ubiquinone oxidoreductase subunit G
MGALTLKSFPFELRGWDLEKFDAIDPTDSFGLNVKVFINNRQIIQIEPSYDSKYPIWVHDKGRQFFDSLIKNTNTNLNNFINSWNNTTKTLYKTIYLFELCGLKYPDMHFFTLIYENLSMNLLCLLSMYAQKYPFIKLKKSEKINLNNDLEFNFLLNKKSGPTKINKSSLCLIVSNNPRFEGSALNLNLRQRLLKGNFKCLIIGSSMDLTYSIEFLGQTSAKILKAIAEGVHFVCQDFKYSKNPILILNTELFKRNDSKNLNQILWYLNNLNKPTWFNTLNASLFETGTQYINKTTTLNQVDLTQFSSIYFINLTTYSNIFINKILKTNLIYLKFIVPWIGKVYLNQNYYENFNFHSKYFTKKFDKYLYLPIKMFFETKDTFLNTEGLIKNSNELITKTQTKSSWKIIRNLFNLKKKKLSYVNMKTNVKINLDLTNQKFKVFINLMYKTTKSLNKNLLLINNQNTNQFYNNKIKLLKIKKIKFFNTKIKLWLNDFFTGGKDEFSRNSLTMIKCSNINRLQSTNFF